MKKCLCLREPREKKVLTRRYVQEETIHENHDSEQNEENNKNDLIISMKHHLRMMLEVLVVELDEDVIVLPNIQVKRKSIG